MGDINFDLNKTESAVTVRVNSKIYPLNVIYSASYVFLDRCYIMLDGDPEVEVVVELRLKDGVDLGLDVLAKEFFNELLNYAFYENQSKKNAQLRNTLLQAALFSDADVDEEPEVEVDDVDWSELDKLEDEAMEDPEGIAIPWEEKYGGSEADEDEAFDSEAMEDPEGIAIPWEEKYGDSGATDVSSCCGGEGNLEEGN
jgi:His-Xaa-Ser system protein HxsD